MKHSLTLVSKTLVERRQSFEVGDGADARFVSDARTYEQRTEGDNTQ